MSAGASLMILDDPRKVNTTGSLVTFTAVTQCAFQRPIEGVTMPEDMEFNVLFNNWQGVRLLPGTLFEARGTVTIEDDRPVLTADLIRVQHGDPDSEDYAKNCLPLCNMRLDFCGPVSAIPVPNGDYRIFTVEVSAYLRKEKSSGLAVFSIFKIHCVFAGAAR
ncbi:hypothetical protein V8E54_009170 [Elaphomyces granulatus]